MSMVVPIGKSHVVLKLFGLFARCIYNSLPVILVWVKKLDIQSGGSDTVLLMENMRGTHKALSKHVIGFLSTFPRYLYAFLYKDSHQ